MILWVDDDIRPSRNSYVREFHDHNYELIIAENPDIMREKLDKYRNDIKLIIMDIMMPTGYSVDVDKADLGQLTGLVLLDEIKADKKYQDIPILIFTIVDRREISDWAEQNNVLLKRKQEVRPYQLIKIIDDMGITNDK